MDKCTGSLRLLGTVVQLEASAKSFDLNVSILSYNFPNWVFFPSDFWDTVLGEKSMCYLL